MPEKPVIAIVDDDESVRDGTADLVKSMGFIAQVFGRAADFLRSDSLDEMSCLILDMRMPGMTGLELHSRLVKSGLNVPTILITAFPNERDRTRAQRAGVICYLSKPFDEGELLACIQSALDHNKAGGKRS